MCGCADSDCVPQSSKCWLLVQLCRGLSRPPPPSIPMDFMHLFALEASNLIISRLSTNSVVGQAFSSNDSIMSLNGHIEVLIYVIIVFSSKSNLSCGNV
jgi:hypothetical protein